MSHANVELPRGDLVDPVPHPPPISKLTPVLFSAFLALAVATWRWPVRWLVSGTPILTFCLLLGASNGDRILSIVPLWTLLTTINLAYAVASTSWLLYFDFTVTIYPAILLTCLFQFDWAARIARRALRKFVRQLQFVQDTVSLFDIPALEIDVDVDGLMVIRGLTISVSTLTVVAHGIEVGIKLADDMELAISTEKVVVKLFRGVEISDCFANIKGGHHEMTFGELEETDKDEDGDAVMVEDTALLQAAAVSADKTSRPRLIKMKSKITNGAQMENSSAKAGLKSIKAVSPEDRDASERYEEMLKWIDDTNLIQQCRKEAVKELDGDEEGIKGIRAVICSKMQATPSVPHPPKRSIKVTTLQNLSPPKRRQFLHRLPMLLRLLLNPISYLHPVSISSITAGGSGQWISYLLHRHLFKDYAEDNKQLRKLQKRILSWLADANFVFELSEIKGVASVPFLTAFDITTLLRFGDVVAYRALARISTEGSDKGPSEDTPPLEEVLRLGGADASFLIPSYLLPHHEHLLPPKPTVQDKEKLVEEVHEADGKPKEVQAERKLEQAEEDETNVKISAHVQLPACFSQDLLNFIAALVKATKVVELEKEPGAMEAKMSGIKEFGHALSKGMKDSVKKTVVDGIVNDKWIAKMVGKITRKLEEAQGDVGYSGDIPVKLEKYRLPEGHPEMNKILS
ncbi:uncharacterized protein I206_105744 [Kwoniella pini CBS 10737]|uniref:Uncharacterized protein n=1 Tax=Kwoniella pini CBS 10737 TaxID=1296096 RepID=A0A1B9I3B9_9TREE|nr:uncharacterized protein I206_03352 [Kwoniella pini CBS 10737]OCF50036.1 hypothetical protein I206_03352 [Kwoniella pini CBS 10737]